jgi:hypothetical protein
VAKCPLKLFCPPNISRRSVTVLLGAATGNFVVIYVSNDKVKNHFTITFRDDSVMEEHRDDYPIS